MRYDEKSLFPKYILEMEAKMKAAHALGIRTSRGARARGDSSQTKPRASHEGTQLNNKRVAKLKLKTIVGSLLGLCRPAIGYLHSLSPVRIPEVFAKVN